MIPHLAKCGIMATVPAPAAGFARAPQGGVHAGASAKVAMTDHRLAARTKEQSIPHAGASPMVPHLAKCGIMRAVRSAVPTFRRAAHGALPAGASATPAVPSQLLATGHMTLPSPQALGSSMIPHLAKCGIMRAVGSPAAEFGRATPGAVRGPALAPAEARLQPGRRMTIMGDLEAGRGGQPSRAGQGQARCACSLEREAIEISWHDGRVAGSS